jgi:phage FluMu protein gp41
MRQFDFQKFLKNNPLLKEGYTPDERIYVGKPSKTGPLAAASDSLYSMEKALKQLDRVIDSNPDISAKSVIKMVLKTLNDIRTKQKIGMNESDVKEGYTPSDKIYIGPPVKSGPLSVASSYLQVLEKNMKTLNKIADSNPDITAKKITSMVLKTFEDIRAAQKSGDPLFQGDFSMNEGIDNAGGIDLRQLKATINAIEDDTSFLDGVTDREFVAALKKLELTFRKNDRGVQMDYLIGRRGNGRIFSNKDGNWTADYWV